MLYFGKNLCWKSCSMALACLHAERFCEHPFSVFEAILKFARRSLPSPPTFFFLPEQALLPLKSGRTYVLRLIFPTASETEIREIQHSVHQWLADPRRHFSATFGEIIHEDAESAVAALPTSMDEEL